MGRKVKYSKELKLEIIKKYLDGESVSHLANEYKISGGRAAAQIIRWVNNYKFNGENAFEVKSANRSYSKEFKLALIHEYLEGNASIEDISNKHSVSSYSILTGWILKYNSHIEIKDYNPHPEVYMADRRKTTKKERIEIVKYCLNNNKNYKKTAFKYRVNYSQVYSWVKKYFKLGEDGLYDGRGRKRDDTKFTELEKLQKENEILCAKAKYLEMENEVLKKLQELERREANERYKKKNTK